MPDIFEDKPSGAKKAAFFFSRYYLLLTGLLCVLIIGGSYLFLLKPKYESLGAGGSYDVAKIRAGLVKRQQYLADLNKLNENYRKVNQSDVERIKKILPAEADIPGLFVSMQKIAVQNNIALTSINIAEAVDQAPAAPVAPAADGEEAAAAPAAPRPAAATGMIGKLNITLNLIGSEDNYNDIKRFLAVLENNLRLFDINAVYFSPGTPAFSVNFTTYFAKK